VVCYTTSGATGIRASRERPAVPVIVISPVVSTARRLSLAWGLHCVVSDDARDENDMVNRACQISYQEGLARPGQRIITTAGVPFGTPGSTNMLRIAFVGSDGLGSL
jgi:pyruvate kinase